MKVLRDHPIRAFAVLCVAVIAVYLMRMGDKVIGTLSGPGWCKAALGAEKASSTDGAIKGLDACVGLFMVQIKALANVSYIYSGGLTLCLVALMIIVVAKGHLDVDVPEKLGGGGLHLGENAAPRAAQEVAGAAKDKADEITEQTKP